MTGSPRLVREDLDAALLERAADAAGARVGLAGAVAALDAHGRRARRSLVVPGLRVRGALTWDRADRRDPRWWPQGVTGSPDAAGGRLLGRRLLLVSWYARGPGGENAGSRVSVLDVDARRYVHVRLALPATDSGDAVLAPLRVHAGGVALVGPWLHVAATGRGLWVAHLDDLLAQEDDLVLPVRYAWRFAAQEGVPARRISFCALSGGSLLTGEYARGTAPRRLTWWPLSPSGELAEVGGTSTAVRSLEGAARMQGAVEVPGHGLQVTVSRGPLTPGSLLARGPGGWRTRRFAVPMGPEDLSYDASARRLWSVTEHPRRRWVCAVRPG